MTLFIALMGYSKISRLDRTHFALFSRLSARRRLCRTPGNIRFHRLNCAGYLTDCTGLLFEYQLCAQLHRTASIKDKLAKNRRNIDSLPNLTQNLPSGGRAVPHRWK